MPRRPIAIKAKEPHIRALFEYMDANGLTIIEASARSGVDTANISNWRRGFGTPRLDLFIAVCDAVGLVWTVAAKHKKRNVVKEQMELPI